MHLVHLVEQMPSMIRFTNLSIGMTDSAGSASHLVLCQPRMEGRFSSRLRGVKTYSEDLLFRHTHCQGVGAYCPIWPFARRQRFAPSPPLLDELRMSIFSSLAVQVQCQSSSFISAIDD